LFQFLHVVDVVEDVDAAAGRATDQRADLRQGAN
jgi:hypothetical protein